MVYQGARRPFPASPLFQDGRQQLMSTILKKWACWKWSTSPWSTVVPYLLLGWLDATDRVGCRVYLQGNNMWQYL